MAKAVKANLKMKLRGGQANAAPPVGSTLGQYGVNMMDFINPFNEATKDQMGQMVTVHIAVYEDKSMTFRVVGLPTDDRIRQKGRNIRFQGASEADGRRPATNRGGVVRNPSHAASRRWWQVY